MYPIIKIQATGVNTVMQSVITNSSSMISMITGSQEYLGKKIQKTGALFKEKTTFFFRAKMDETVDFTGILEGLPMNL